MKIKRITHEELEERLKERALYFFHKKVNGDIKRVFGTLCKERLPSKALPPPEHIGCVCYYDIIVAQYRSCSKKLEVWQEI